jgi:hypothetical protein
MRTLGMARDLAFAPGRQTLVEVLEHLLGLLVERLCFALDIGLRVRPGHGSEFFGLAFDLCERFLEVEVIGHRMPHLGLARYKVGKGANATRQDLCPGEMAKGSGKEADFGQRLRTAADPCSGLCP